MKLACQKSNGKWCGTLHEPNTPNHLLCQAAFIHPVTDDAIGLTPWTTHLYRPEPARKGRGGPRPGFGGKQPGAGRPVKAVGDKPVAIIVDPDTARKIDALRGDLSRAEYLRRLVDVPQLF